MSEALTYPYYARGSSTSFGTGRSSGKSVGDLVFMYRGQTGMTFRQITDPNGVARLAKAARRSMINLVKTNEKIQAKAMREKRTSFLDELISRFGLNP